MMLLLAGIEKQQEHSEPQLIAAINKKEKISREL